jgi:hypothetical protein
MSTNHYSETRGVGAEICIDQKVSSSFVLSELEGIQFAPVHRIEIQRFAPWCVLIERFEEFGGFREGGIVVADGFCLHGFKWLLGGNAVEPALMREFFVVGEIETD